MFIKLIILSSILVTLVMAGLGISILIKRQGRFPDTHIGSNPEMRKRGISCAKSTNLGCNSSLKGGCCMNAADRQTHHIP